MKKAIKFGLIAIVALIAISVIFGEGNKQTSTDNASTASENQLPETQKVEAIKVSALKIAESYEENEAAADDQYKDKLLEVSGKITGIKKGMLDETIIDLGGKNQFIPVQGTLTSEEAPKALKLKKGDQVTLQCKGAGEVASFPMLNNCSIL